MFFIESDRLRLIPLNYTQLLLLRQNRKLLENAMGLNPSNMVIDLINQHEINDALDNFWLPNIQLYPDKYMWYTVWEVILKATNTSAGGICLGYPDENGESITGYCIDKNQQNKGYATEALKRICAWGFENPDIKSICAETGTNNYPSQRLLIKTGFTEITATADNVVFKLSRQPKSADII